MISLTAIGFNRSGVRGALAGFLRGLAGCGVKPAVGLLDFVSKLSEGVKNTAEVLSVRQRM